MSNSPMVEGYHIFSYRLQKGSTILSIPLTSGPVNKIRLSYDYKNMLYKHLEDCFPQYDTKFTTK